MQDQHQASHSQQKLGKAGPSSWRGRCQEQLPLLLSREHLWGDCQCRVSLHLLLWRSEVEYTCISWIALSNQCHPFPRWLGRAEGTIVHEAGESSEKLPHTSAKCCICCVCSHWRPSHPPALDLAAPAMGSFRVNSGPQSMKKSQGLTFLWCQGPQVPTAASMPIAVSTAGRLIPRERQHMGVALCFKFQQNQSFKVLTQKEWKLREKTPDQHYICLESWK